MQKGSAQLLLVYQLPSIYKTKKKILTYRKNVCNSSQSNLNLLADHINAEIIIIPAIDLDFFGRQYDMVVQLAVVDIA